METQQQPSGTGRIFVERIITPKGGNLVVAMIAITCPVSGVLKELAESCGDHDSFTLSECNNPKGKPVSVLKRLYNGDPVGDAHTTYVGNRNEIEQLIAILNWLGKSIDRTN